LISNPWSPRPSFKAASTDSIFRRLLQTAKWKAALLAAVAHIGDNLSHGFTVGRAQRDGQLRLR
jgi:hypothetical protein